MTESDFSEIRSTIDSMRLLDTKYRVFGSQYHKYQFAGPIPEETVLAFEKENHFRLPEEYRLFMTHLGPGAGPDRGVPGLREMLGRDFSAPFPFEHALSYEHNPELEEWENSLSLFPGMMPICYQGGTLMTELVVNGKASGTMWLMEERGILPLNQTFGEWYFDWLHWLKETAAPTLIRDQITEQVHPGMTRAEVMSLCSATGGEWRETRLWEETYDLKFADLLTTFRMTYDNIVQTTTGGTLYHRLEEDEDILSAVTNRT